MNIDIRWMVRRDMPDVLRIEEESFEYPWFDCDFMRALRQRNCMGLVAEVGEEIAGFVIYELHKTRLHVLDLAIDHRFRRKGVGTALVNKLASKLSPDRRSRIMLEVRESNVLAQLFFRANGFRAVSVMREFYQEISEDAYLFQRRVKQEMLDAIAHNG